MIPLKIFYPEFLYFSTITCSFKLQFFSGVNSCYFSRKKDSLYLQSLDKGIRRGSSKEGNETFIIFCLTELDYSHTDPESRMSFGNAKTFWVGGFWFLNVKTQIFVCEPNPKTTIGYFCIYLFVYF